MSNQRPPRASARTFRVHGGESESGKMVERDGFWPAPQVPAICR
jgi:hypothetical protein